MYNEDKILKWIYEKPTYWFHMRELARLTKLHPNTIINLTDKLTKKNIIVKKRNKSLVEVKADLESEDYLINKRLFNLKNIYSSGLLKKLIDFYNGPKAIVIYGSYERGEDDERSDIDIIIISNNNERLDLMKFENILKRSIHLLVIKSHNEISKELYSNIINGNVLYGRITLK